MQPVLLQTFLAVVRAGGMRRAATGLHVSQPAVSARIRELESRLGVRLLTRLGRGIELTAAGRLLAEEAPALLAAHTSLVERLQAVDTAARATLRIATIDAASVYVLPPVYLDYRALHPDVTLIVQVVDSRHVAAAVRAAEADVGVATLPVRDAELDCVPIFEEELVCVAPSPAAGSAPGAGTPLSDVAAHPLILYPRGSTTRALLDAEFASRGIDPNVVMETASP